MPDLPLVALGDTDENADWLLTEKVKAEEAALHEELGAGRQKAAGAFEWILEIKGGPGSGNWRHTGLAGVHGGADAGGGLGKIHSWGHVNLGAHDQLKESFSDWVGGLSDAEEKTFDDWIYGWAYKDLNGVLRGKKEMRSMWGEQQMKVEQMVPRLDAALERARMPITVSPSGRYAHLMTAEKHSVR